MPGFWPNIFENFCRTSCLATNSFDSTSFLFLWKMINNGMDAVLVLAHEIHFCLMDLYGGSDWCVVCWRSPSIIWPFGYEFESQWKCDDEGNYHHSFHERSLVVISIFFLFILLLGKNIYSWMAWRSRDKYCVVSFWKVIGNIWKKRIVDRGEWVLDNNWNWNIYLGFLCSFDFTNISILFKKN